MQQPTLFDLDDFTPPDPAKTEIHRCGSCQFLEEHFLNNTSFKYCGVRTSPRTYNGQLKVTEKTKACILFTQADPKIHRHAYKKLKQQIFNLKQKIFTKTKKDL